MTVRAQSSIAWLCAVALAVALSGCKNSAQVFEDNNEGGWFSKKMDLFTRPDWSVIDNKTYALGPSGPVAANELVGPDGRCAAAAQPAAVAPAPPPAPADRPVGSAAGDLAGSPMPAMASANPNDVPADPNGPEIIGGIALGMTECDAVRRAGTPGKVAISAGQRGERAVTLTYLAGTWPGIYRFSDGRLKEIDRAPAPPEEPKPVKKQKAKKTVKPKTATSQAPTRATAQ